MKTRGLTHMGDVLSESVANATKRPIGRSGGWGWQPIRDAHPVTDLEAVTLAHFGASTSKRRSNSGEGRKVVVLG